MTSRSYKKWHGYIGKKIKSDVGHSIKYLDPCGALVVVVPLLLYYYLIASAIWLYKPNVVLSVQAGGPSTWAIVTIASEGRVTNNFTIIIRNIRNFICKIFQVLKRHLVPGEDIFLSDTTSLPASYPTLNPGETIIVQRSRHSPGTKGTIYDIPSLDISVQNQLKSTL